MYPIIKLRNARISFWITQFALFLTFSYVAYNYYLSWRLDFTTTMMGICVRLHTLTWDLADGQNYSALKNGKYEKFVKFRQKHACKNITFLEYLCYMAFFVQSIGGSNLTINDYLAITDGTIFKKVCFHLYFYCLHFCKLKNGWRDSKNEPYPNSSSILKAISDMILTYTIYMVSQQYLSFAILSTNAWKQKPFLFKFAVFPMLVFFGKFKYHFGFKCFDMCTLMSGAAFSGVEYETDDDGKYLVKKIEWNRSRNIRSLPAAFPQKTADITDNWNITVSDWIKYC